MSAKAPSISVVMANYNGAAHLGAAIRSVLRQTHADLELVFSDDCSSDDSVAQAKAAAGDPRFVLVESGRRTGPAATRNRALAAARGDWVAIVDSDDFIHPERLAHLLSDAKADGADIVADDMLTFYQDRSAPPHAHLRGALAQRPTWISAADYADANHLFGSGVSLGYLKPMFRRLGPDGAPRAYDESLRIAEDFDLVMRMLIGGAKMRVYPRLDYFYRKHASSISHRLSAADITTMLAAHDGLARDLATDPPLQAALGRRHASLRDAQTFDAMVSDIKAGRVAAALVRGIARPSAMALLRYPLLDRFKRKRPGAAPAPAAPTVRLSRRPSADPTVIEAPAALSGRAAALHLSAHAQPDATCVLVEDIDLTALAPYLLAPDAEVVVQRP